MTEVEWRAICPMDERHVEEMDSGINCDMCRCVLCACRIVGGFACCSASAVVVVAAYSGLQDTRRLQFLQAMLVVCFPP